MYAGARLAGVAAARLDAGRGSRLLVQAVLASMALHALLLVLLPVWDEVKRQLPAPPLVARIAKPPPEPPRVEPPRPPAPPRTALAPKAAPKPAPSPAPVPAPSPPVIALPTPAPASEAPAFSVPVQPPAPARAPEAAAPATAPRAAPAPAQAGPDPDSIARFRIELLQWAKRYERYPRIARDNGWEGRVGLRVQVAQTGALASVSVTRSSGRVVLDDEAQAMIRSGHAKTPVPPELRGRAFSLDVFIDFRLVKDDGG